MITVAAWLLTPCGAALVEIGGYFVLARPALLPSARIHVRPVVRAP